LAAKILALADPDLRQRVVAAQQAAQDTIVADDASLRE
jgi:phosphoribosylcarboxyaminoimidazole (NCAIR) mutase